MTPGLDFATDSSVVRLMITIGFQSTNTSDCLITPILSI